MAADPAIQRYFAQLRTICVPLLGVSRLTGTTLAQTSSLLKELNQCLDCIPVEKLTPNIISYVFLPISAILHRNASAEIPDHLLERILISLEYLAEGWWWTCEFREWEQIFMLCGSVIGGIESKDKGKARDEETRTAAARCLYTILRTRTDEEARKRDLPTGVSQTRLGELHQYTRKPEFAPVVGSTLDSLLISASTHNLLLQRTMLQIIALLVEYYLPDWLITSVLPGVVSTMTKVSIGVRREKGWTNGETVSLSLHVMQIAISKAIGDEVCIKHGALRRLQNLSDLLSTNEPPKPSTLPDTRYGTPRTESWLRGTSSQLHIAINSLTPLLTHPTVSALRAMVVFSFMIAKATPLALPQSQSLLLSFLLTLSLSEYPVVSTGADQSIRDLLSKSSDAQLGLQQSLINILGISVSSIPRLLASGEDAKVRHTAGLIEAICRLNSGDDGVSLVGKSVSKILGPAGGIEKWGWSLLSVIEISEPRISSTHVSSAQLALETDPEDLQHIKFPLVVLKNVSTQDTQRSLTAMFHALGAAAGVSGFFSVEWFLRTGLSGLTSVPVAALWCACRLFEGIGGVSLLNEPFPSFHHTYDRRLDKHCQLVARAVAEVWDDSDPVPLTNAQEETIDSPIMIHYQQGLVPLEENLKILRQKQPSSALMSSQPFVHRALCLQLLAISSGISPSHTAPLFIHTLYPILHSLVSSASFLSSTALATLNYISTATSHASPANLLLSNFDYILDAISRRLTPRWLDVDATKVLGIIIRLVGVDIVEKAADVVEECFDRLDEFHGYDIIVQGLVQVLTEVLSVIELDAKTNPMATKSKLHPISQTRKRDLDEFTSSFLPKRMENPFKDDETDYGPAPRRPWGDIEEKDNEDAHNGLKVEATPDENPATVTVVQALTNQIITRSLYFLTHPSPVIRARTLHLLTSSVHVLSESSLLPAIHSAWPFILNRLGDSETFVVSAAAGLIESLSTAFGDFMFRKVWDDVWPRFRAMLGKLDKADRTHALVRLSNENTSGSAYTHSHRLYRSIIKSVTAVLKGVHPHEPSFWEVIILFRRFLASQNHDDLQQDALKLYQQAANLNADAVWLLLSASTSKLESITDFLLDTAKWDIDRNASVILQTLSSI